MPLLIGVSQKQRVPVEYNGSRTAIAIIRITLFFTVSTYTIIAIFLLKVHIPLLLSLVAVYIKVLSQSLPFQMGYHSANVCVIK